jgi:hypothetical protein
MTGVLQLGSEALPRTRKIGKNCVYALLAAGCFACSRSPCKAFHFRMLFTQNLILDLILANPAYT